MYKPSEIPEAVFIADADQLVANIRDLLHVPYFVSTPDGVPIAFPFEDTGRRHIIVCEQHSTFWLENPEFSYTRLEDDQLFDFSITMLRRGFNVSVTD